MQNCFNHWLVPDSTTCLGIELKPFSLAHFVYLNLVGSPFVSNQEQEASIGDCLLAIKICSMNHQEIIKFTSDLELNVEEFQAWGKSVKDQGFDIAEEFEVFASYLSRSTEAPQFIIKDMDNPTSIGAPMWQVIRITLMKELGYRDEDLWDAPLSKVYSDYFTLKEICGQLNLKTPEHFELDKIKQEYYAKHPEEGRLKWQ